MTKQSKFELKMIHNLFNTHRPNLYLKTALDMREKHKKFQYGYIDMQQGGLASQHLVP